MPYTLATVIGSVKAPVLVLGLLLAFSAFASLAAASLAGPENFSTEATEQVEIDDEFKPDWTSLSAAGLFALAGYSIVTIGAPTAEQLRTGIFPETLTPPPEAVEKQPKSRIAHTEFFNILTPLK